ncbi:MAG: SMC-Scp complex subunit ScpB [Propionibacteriaceae bacterium]|jgi:segregation and condensation protein B|nr:SMC-Scp complex subunit ScpB [Propionibacteriaceae bacterium]
MAGIAPQLEALLLLADEPLDAATLATAVDAPVTQVEETLTELAAFYLETGRGFVLREVAGGWRYYTAPEHHEMIAAWVSESRTNQLTQAGLETLAVIAYLQPVPRSRVGAVRGVNVDSAVRTLLARGLIEETEPPEGSSAGQLRTTPYFLERLGLSSLDDLPEVAPLLPDATTLEAELSAIASNTAPTS